MCCHFLLSPSFYFPVNIPLPPSPSPSPPGPGCHICSTSITSTCSCHSALHFIPKMGAGSEAGAVIEILSGKSVYICIDEKLSCPGKQQCLCKQLIMSCSNVYYHASTEQSYDSTLTSLRVYYSNQDEGPVQMQPRGRYFRIRPHGSRQRQGTNEPRGLTGAHTADACVKHASECETLHYTCHFNSKYCVNESIQLQRSGTPS